MKTKSYEDLIVWQKSIRLTKEVYKITYLLPASEKYGLSSQLQRAAVSIPSNIAEGYGRGTLKDYTRFLKMARGSLFELRTQITILKDLRFGININYSETNSLVIEISKMLHVMINPRLRSD